MILKEKQQIRVAILDLYEGQPNQGMRCLRNILNSYASANLLELVLHEFEVRLEHKVPDLSYDIYISSGGPGSPLDSKGSTWEQEYFTWLASVEAFNNDSSNATKK